MRSEPGPLYWEAQAAALKFLGARLKTEAQVERKLQEKDYPEEVRTAVLDFLREYGYVDDAGYCDSFIRDCSRFHPYGRYRLRLELQGRGVARSVIEAALDRAELDETANAAALLRKKLPDPANAEAKQKQKAAAFLQRRGYSLDTIHQAFALVGEDREDF